MALEDARAETGRSGELRLAARRLGIDTHQEPVVYLRQDSPVCRSEGLEANSRVRLESDSHSVIATLNVVRGDLLQPGEAGLSESAWTMLRVAEGDDVRVRHARPLGSLGYVRSKLYGHGLSEAEIRAIVGDIAAGRYSDVQIAAFVAAGSGDHLDEEEVVALARSMADVGERLRWDHAPIVDKHSVGGLPGNRTTPIVVPIVCAAGLTMPKTSSRAITSPAGTADTMEVLAPVTLDLAAMRRVVEREGGCIVWGGAVRLSPTDETLIRVERSLDLDSEGQLVASILSKKAAAGATHVLIDMPVGPTAKVRTRESADRLSERLVRVGRRLDLQVEVAQTDGAAPVGRGLGPALEARDVLAVLQGRPEAPGDLRARALAFAGRLLEIGGAATAGVGPALASRLLDEGRAWRKFQAICEAQGGMREPPTAAHRHEVRSAGAGRIVSIDNRKLARVAKLAGAPTDPAAGLDLHVRLGDAVERDQPLFTVQAEAAGELAYALEYLAGQTDVLTVEAGA